jgi:transposase
MSKQRKKYTLEFKREAVQLWENSCTAAAEIEKDLGISTGLIYRWKRQLNQKAAAQADGSAAETAEMRRLAAVRARRQSASRESVRRFGS